MRWLSPVLAVFISFPATHVMSAQNAGPALNIVIVEGDGAINNIRQRTAREPIVQVEDENHKPVAGAAVVFALPGQGAGGTFAGGAHTLSVVTDSQGRAVARGFHPNTVQGQYQIHVTASNGGQTATANISQSNALAAAGAGTTAAAAGISGKLIAVIVIVAAAAAAGGAYAATHSGSGNSSSSSAAASLVTIAPGTGVVGPPK
jgi:hypothetical protein